MIKRVFLGWNRPVLVAAARRLIEERSNNGSADFRGVVAAVPGGRAGRRLKELLLEGADKAGLRLVPPRVVTTGGLPELFYESQSSPASDLVARLAWSRALQSAAPDAVQAIFGQIPEAGDRRGWDRMAAEVTALHRDVAGGGHRFEDVGRVCEGGSLGFDDSERWHHLAAFQTSYLERLERLGLDDLDMARLAAANGETPLSADSEVVVIGAADLPAITATILSRAVSTVEVWIHAPESRADGFDSAGRVVPERWRQHEIPIRPEQLRTVDRPTAQAAEVLKGVAELGVVRAGDVVVSAADADLVPYLEDWFGDAGIPTHFGAGRAIRSSSPVRLLLAIAGYLESGAWDQFAALARHPDLDDRLRRAGDAVRAGALDEFFREHFPADLRDELPVGYRRDAEALRRKLLESRWLGRFTAERPLAEWGAEFIDFLIDVYGDRPVNPNQADVRALLDVLFRLRSAALALHQLPIGLSDPVAASFAIYLIVDLVESDSVAEEAEGDPVEIVGWLELAMDDAPHAFVVGVNEGALPGSRRAHPFLPDRLRSRLGLQDNATLYARDAFLLQALLQSRRTVRLISGRITADGDPLRPSRLTLTARGEDLARAVTAFLDAPSRRIDPPLVGRAAAKSAFRLPPEPTIRFEPPTALSVTEFGRILGDPYRWALENHLRLKMRDDRQRELDAMGFGTTAHRVLSRFSRSEQAHSTDATSIAGVLDQLLDEEWAGTFGARTFPAVALQAEFLRLRLHAFARWQAAWVAKGWRTILVEGGGVDADESDEEPTLTASFPVDGEDFTLKGRIDRLDWNADTGQLAVLDYKTGDVPKLPEKVHLSKDVWKDLQLPLYRHLLSAAVAQPGVPADVSTRDPLFGYILLSRELEMDCFATEVWNGEKLDEADEAARDVVRWVRGGVARFDRDVNPWPGDPFIALLGKRQLLGDDDLIDPEEEEEEEK